MLAGEWSAANAAATLAAALWPGEPDFHLLQSSAAWQLARHDPSQSEAALQQAESALLQARQTRPGDWTIWLHTAQFYASAARRFGVDGRSRVFDAYRRAAALAPDRAAVYTAWGRAYLEEQNPHAAAPLLRQALSLDATSETAAAYLQTAEQEMESFNGR
jgi:cytochrome c-type biogenesis protein CcmH/NrfG